MALVWVLCLITPSISSVEEKYKQGLHSSDVQQVLPHLPWLLQHGPASLQHHTDQISSQGTSAFGVL